jgi:hypothetical protein
VDGLGQADGDVVVPPRRPQDQAGAARRIPVDRVAELTPAEGAQQLDDALDDLHGRRGVVHRG